VLPAGTEAVCGENEPLTDAGGEEAVAMETVAVDNEVPDGDVQREEATENMKSPAAGQVSTEEGDGDASQVKDAPGDPETVTETTGERTDEDEVQEPETTHRPQSLDDNTEPPAACSQSPAEPGNLLPLDCLHGIYPLLYQPISVLTIPTSVLKMGPKWARTEMSWYRSGYRTPSQ